MDGPERGRILVRMGVGKAGVKVYVFSLQTALNGRPGAVRVVEG